MSQAALSPRDLRGDPGVTGGAVPRDLRGEPGVTGSAVPRDLRGEPGVTGGAVPRARCWPSTPLDPEVKDRWALDSALGHAPTPLTRPHWIREQFIELKSP